MKLFPIITSLFFLVMVSCQRPEVAEYVYEKNPQYGWGYVEFWGPYYAQYGNMNHVLSVHLFTDSLEVNAENSNLVGFGQYLMLEDVFVHPTDSILPEGVYTVSESGEPFTLAPGEQVVFDNEKYDVGALIYYMERNNDFSTRKWISSGTMTVQYTSNKFRIICDFILSDGQELKGTFQQELPHFDMSEINQGAPRKAGRKNVLPGF